MSFLQTTLANPESLPASEIDLDNGATLRILDTGVLQVSPPKSLIAGSEYRVVISSGIHGNETAPMEIVERLVQDIEAGTLNVANELLFIIGNPQAVNAEQRFVEENLNRLFSARHAMSKTIEADRAKQLERFVTEFFNAGNQPRLHYDLHTAIRGSEIEKFAVYPFLHTRSMSRPQLGFLERCGIEASLMSNQPSGTFSYYSSHTHHADAFTIELGKVRKFGENDMSRFAEIDQGLRGLICGVERFESEPRHIQMFTVVEEVIKQSEAFRLHIPDNAKNFTEYPAGVVLASDEAYEYRTQQDGERFVFPIVNVPCGQRAMLVVAPSAF